MKPFFLYMLRCADGSYYVGHTDDLDTRVAQHQEGSLGGHTSSRRPVELVYSCEFETRDEAFEREMQVKGWSRAKKEALIRGDWAALPELSRSRTGPGTSPPLVLRQAQHERVPDEDAQVTDVGVPDEIAQITEVGGGRGSDA
ncbi:GIY-YIG nuclease family protein [Anaeromyxobacter terrae]|uniref:GIY-YIG nuclease family protein n=1 Tax=Anaeromyxobacter terrae TaxID=2925406 RepID=UPI001F581CA5|nr:GIY-YIG nuclease family protein [Anaeromyxobacter sp. SG22]